MEVAQIADRAASRVARAMFWLRRGVNFLRRSPGHVRVDLRWRLGDEIMALPIYEAICRLRPGARVSVSCNYPELLCDNPYASPADCAVPGPDRLIDLRSGPRHVYRPAHYAQLAGVPMPQSRPRLCYHDWHTPLMDGITGPFVVVAAGASWQNKRWPAENWRALCSVVQDLGYSIVELGHDGEQVDAGLCLAGKTTVREAACILHAARLLVTCDSGLMHLALAADTPVLALFGPTDPDILIRNEPLFHPVRSRFDCAGCWNRVEQTLRPGECPRLAASTISDFAPCMLDITPDLVAEKLRRLLKPAVSEPRAAGQGT